MLYHERKENEMAPITIEQLNAFATKRETVTNGASAKSLRESTLRGFATSENEVGNPIGPDHKMWGKYTGKSDKAGSLRSVDDVVTMFEKIRDGLKLDNVTVGAWSLPDDNPFDVPAGEYVILTKSA
jgi:hypothetical protein